MELKLLLLSLVLSSVNAVPADISKALNNTDNYGGYRLPNIYSPSEYLVDLVVLQDVFNGSHTNFRGIVSIIFQLTADTEQIQLHAPNANVSVTLSIKNSTTSISNQTYNETTSILTLHLSSNLPIYTVCELNATYMAKLSTSSMRGFYRSVYDDENGAQYLVTTQFQPTHAREAFPCFDEPHFKAKFNISITYPKGLNAKANTPQIGTPEVSSLGADYETARFETTPRMSTYLLAFIVSKFTCTSGRAIAENITHQVCSRNDTEADRVLANKVGPELMEILQSITNITYSSMGFGKMDQAAIPDFSAGAMENWGLVTYRETALLYNDNDSSNSNKQRIVSVIAHEFAHMWFGNLVTMDWWDYTFLNEGFARYFQYFATAKLYPDWEMALQFIVEQQQSIFVSDGFNSSNSLTSLAASPSLISNKFSSLSYNKGAAVIRMIENFIGSESLTNAIREYLRNHSSSTAVPSDLVEALEIHTSPTVLPKSITLSTVLDNWLNEPGYPVVTASLNSNSVTLSQKRFLYNGTSTTKWHVPISYTISSNANFSNVSASAWLLPQNNLTLNLTLSANEWIILNNRESAYYRVNYDTNLWSRISHALSTNHSSIDVINRAQIVDDLFNLARAGVVTYNHIFSSLEYLKNETEYYPWYSAIVGFNFLLQRYGENSELGKRLNSWQLELLQNVYKSVSFTNLNETDHVYSLKLPTILVRACKLGHADCINISKSFFQAAKKNGTSIDKNLKTVVYCTALRYSDNIEDDWHYLWELYRKYTAQSAIQATLLSIFGCTKNTRYLNDALERSLNAASGIRLQDFSSLWSSVYTSNPEGIDAAFNFFVNNHARISSYYSGAETLLLAIISRFTTNTQIQRLNTVINSGNFSSTLQSMAVAAATVARNNLDWASTTRVQFEEYFNINAEGTNTNAVTNATTPTPNTTKGPVISTTPASANVAVLSKTALLLVLLIGIFF